MAPFSPVKVINLRQMSSHIFNLRGPCGPDPLLCWFLKADHHWRLTDFPTLLFADRSYLTCSMLLLPVFLSITCILSLLVVCGRIYHDSLMSEVPRWLVTSLRIPRRAVILLLSTFLSGLHILIPSPQFLQLLLFTLLAFGPLRFKCIHCIHRCGLVCVACVLCDWFGHLQLSFFSLASEV